jgi:hypothetical protein
LAWRPPRISRGGYLCFGLLKFVPPGPPLSVPVLVGVNVVDPGHPVERKENVKKKFQSAPPPNASAARKAQVLRTTPQSQ